VRDADQLPVPCGFTEVACCFLSAGAYKSERLPAPRLLPSAGGRGAVRRVYGEALGQLAVVVFMSLSNHKQRNVSTPVAPLGCMERRPRSVAAHVFNRTPRGHACVPCLSECARLVGV
jgi:hypothetical protein